MVHLTPLPTNHTHKQCPVNVCMWGGGRSVESMTLSSTYQNKPVVVMVGGVGRSLCLEGRLEADVSFSVDVYLGGVEECGWDDTYRVGCLQT